MHAHRSSYNANKFLPRSYQLNGFILLDKMYFTDVVCRSQKSKKLGSKLFSPFLIVSFIGKYAVQLDLSSTLHVHNVVHIDHTKPNVAQPLYTIASIRSVAELYIDEKGKQLISICVDLAHKKKRRNDIYFLVLSISAPTCKASWQALKNS